MKTRRSPVTTHVLDLGTGRPGKGIRVLLKVKEKEKGWRELGRGVTDADGRVENLLPAAVRIEPGTYSLTFDLAERSSRSPSSPSRKFSSSPFFPEITITFVVTDPAAHYHVPLLLSPYGYSTYRGT
jgi:5-hydroxyisourate hydrolase